MHGNNGSAGRLRENQKGCTFENTKGKMVYTGKATFYDRPWNDTNYFTILPLTFGFNYFSGLKDGKEYFYYPMPPNTASSKPCPWSRNLPSTCDDPTKPGQKNALLPSEAKSEKTKKVTVEWNCCPKSPSRKTKVTIDDGKPNAPR